jgi:hypothetical protein
MPNQIPTSDLAKLEAAVRYLEAVQNGAVRAYDTAGRLFVLRVILTVTLLAVAAGVARMNSGVDLPWFGLELDPAAVLVGGSVLASVLQFLDVLHYERGHKLSIRAVRLYEELGFTTPREEWKSAENPVRLQFAAAVSNEPLLKQISYDAASLGGQIVALGLLLVAQVGVFLALREKGYDGVWLYVFLLLPLATAVFSAVRYVRIFKDHKADNADLENERSRRIFA